MFSSLSLSHFNTVSATYLLDAKAAMPEGGLFIRDFILKGLDIRLVSTIFCIFCVGFLAARSYTSFPKNGGSARLDTEVSNCILIAPILLLCMKYAFIAVFYKFGSQSMDFSNNLVFTRNSYIIFGIVDLITIVALVIYNKVGRLAYSIITSLTFFLIFLIRVLIYFGTVEYFFSGLALDFIYGSFLMILILSEIKFIFSVLKKFWAWLRLSSTHESQV